jgi:hypothetical protein
MSKPTEPTETCEVVLTFTDLETGQREMQVVQGVVRRNVELTPEEREKYLRFHKRRQAEAALRAKSE